jgi:MFS family permease
MSASAEEHGPRLGLVIGALMLVMLLAALDQTIVSTALPTIVGELGGLEHISWVVTAYLLAVTVVTPLAVVERLAYELAEPAPEPVAG